MNTLAEKAGVTKSYIISLAAFFILSIWRAITSITFQIGFSSTVDYLFAAFVLIAALFVENENIRTYVQAAGVALPFIISGIFGNAIRYSVLYIGKMFETEMGSGARFLFVTRYTSPIAFYIFLLAAAVLIAIRKKNAACCAGLLAVAAAIWEFVIVIIIGYGYMASMSLNFKTYLAYWAQNLFRDPIYNILSILLGILIIILNFSGIKEIISGYIRSKKKKERLERIEREKSKPKNSNSASKRVVMRK